MLVYVVERHISARRDVRQPGFEIGLHRLIGMVAIDEEQPNGAAVPHRARRAAARGEPGGRPPHPAADLDDLTLAFAVARQAVEHVAFDVVDPALDFPEARRKLRELLCDADLAYDFGMHGGASLSLPGAASPTPGRPPSPA